MTFILYLIAYLLIFLCNDAHTMPKQLSDWFLDNVLDILKFDQYLKLKSNQIRVESKVVF